MAIELKPKNRASGLRIRDVEGGEAGTEWSEAEWSTGAIAHPGTSPTPSEARGNAQKNEE
jgi:hypothetical protein